VRARAHLLGQRHIGDAAIALQGGQYPAVEIVKIDHARFPLDFDYLHHFSPHQGENQGLNAGIPLAFCRIISR
jgi:hypothetical protein